MENELVLYERVKDFVIFMQLNSVFTQDFSDQFGRLQTYLLDQLVKIMNSNDPNDPYFIFYNQLKKDGPYETFFKTLTTKSAQGRFFGTIFFQAKQLNIPVTLNVLNKPNQIKYYQTYDIEQYNKIFLTERFTTKIHFANLSDLVTFNDYIDIITYVEEANKLIIIFRQTDKIKDFLKHINIIQKKYMDLYPTKYFGDVKNNDVLYNKIKDIYIHGGIHDSALMESDEKVDLGDGVEKSSPMAFLISKIMQFKKVADENNEIIDKEILITGHSKGAAFATIFSTILHDFFENSELGTEFRDFSMYVLATGCPPLFDIKYVNYIDEIINNKKNFTYYNLLTKNDGVAGAIPRFLNYDRPKRTILLNYEFSKRQLKVTNYTDPGSFIYFLRYFLWTLISFFFNSLNYFNPNLIAPHFIFIYTTQLQLYLNDKTIYPRLD